MVHLVPVLDDSAIEQEEEFQAADTNAATSRLEPFVRPCLRAVVDDARQHAIIERHHVLYGHADIGERPKEPRERALEGVSSERHAVLGEGFVMSLGDHTRVLVVPTTLPIPEHDRLVVVCPHFVFGWPPTVGDLRPQRTSPRVS